MFGFRKQPVDALIGAFFKPASPTSLGRDMPTWQVQSILPGSVAGVDHARLIGCDQPTETRIVAVSVLTDPKRYRRVS